MNPMSVALIVIIFLLTNSCVKTYEIPILLYRVGYRQIARQPMLPQLLDQPLLQLAYCYFNNRSTDCSLFSGAPYMSSGAATTENELHAINTKEPFIQKQFRRFMPQQNMNTLPTALRPHQPRVPNRNTLMLPKINHVVNLKLDSVVSKNFGQNSKIFSQERTDEVEATTPLGVIQTTTNKVSSTEYLSNSFMEGLDLLERKFYLITFNQLSSISPANRRENGISFVQSGLFLQLVLVGLSTEVDANIRREIEDCINIHVSSEDKIEMIRQTLAFLPRPSDELKFRWSSRLALWPARRVSGRFRAGAAAALQLHLEPFNGTETPETIARTLNHMVEVDSGGAMHDTFQEEEVSEGVQAVLVTTLYLRARWRSAPTLLGGTRAFREAPGPGTTRALRCIRLNDMMRYAHLPEWGAEAIEIFYATPGLSLLILVPRGGSLRALAQRAGGAGLPHVTQRMRTARVAATLPLYTLRMTLLLPNKLQAMGISGLFNSTAGSLSLSHAVQRIMFWAEAGRNAFKDDGIEWDEPPELELVVDRPYIFFVRWRNVTIINGNFVL